MLLYFSISVSSSHPVRIWQSGRDCYVVAVLGYVMRFMTIRPCCLSEVILLHSFTELAPADLIWSAQYVGYLPQGLEPSALPWTIRRSMGWSPCREEEKSEERKDARLYCWEQNLIDTEFLKYRDIRVEFDPRNSQHFSSAPLFQSVYFMPLHISKFQPRIEI